MNRDLAYESAPAYRNDPEPTLAGDAAVIALGLLVIWLAVRAARWAARGLRGGPMPLTPPPPVHWWQSVSAKELAAVLAARKVADELRRAGIDPVQVLGQPDEGSE